MLMLHLQTIVNSKKSKNIEIFSVFEEVLPFRRDFSSFVLLFLSLHIAMVFEVDMWLNFLKFLGSEHFFNPEHEIPGLDVIH